AKTAKTAAFNATTIDYALPQNAHVYINVFDITGKEIATLVNANEQFGKHSVQWDGRLKNGRLAPSGIYFYRIRAADFSQVKKLLFVQ
ncbi:MAG: T9SS C-terminal target domain-containing protein, partial [Calditrichaeota bacterium]